uniref:Uncharacterized protein n=1 Tax=Amphimedon queenslandica TaxID=400682 RepID=A0A1X7VC70_AMPQE
MRTLVIGINKEDAFSVAPNAAFLLCSPIEESDSVSSAIVAKFHTLEAMGDYLRHFHFMTHYSCSVSIFLFPILCFYSVLLQLLCVPF